MTPRERVERALRRERPDQVPFTIYESKIPQCAAERRMRNRGLCIVSRRNVFQTHHPDVKTHQVVYPDPGRLLTRELFETYTLPHYQEAAEIMHGEGKLIGSHFDDNCKLLAPVIAKTDLDYIEAFTPAPGSDMSLGEARRAWPDKVLWLNFPSAVHLRPDPEVEQTTGSLLDELESVDGLIMGITEDIPPERWRRSCTAIQDGLRRHARTHPGLYDAAPR